LSILYAVYCFNYIIAARIIVEHFTIGLYGTAVFAGVVVCIANIILRAGGPFGSGIAVNYCLEFLNGLCIIVCIQINVRNVILCLLAHTAKRINAQHTAEVAYGIEGAAGAVITVCHLEHGIIAAWFGPNGFVV